MAVITQGERGSGKPHHISLEDRRILIATGVSNVDSFDEQTIVAYTDLGELTIRGQGLKINHLNVETGELSVGGEVQALIYTQNQPRSAGFLSRLFR